LMFMAAKPLLTLSAMLEDETVALFEEEIGDARLAPALSMLIFPAGGITATRLW
jgi:hypothetical protein